MKTLSLRTLKKVALFTSAAVLAFSFSIPSMSAASTESEQNIVAKAYPTLSSSNVGTSYTQLGGQYAIFTALNGPVSFSVDQNAASGTQTFTMTYQIRETKSGRIVATQSLSGKRGGSSPTASLYFGSIGEGTYAVYAKVVGASKASATVQVYAN